MNNHFDLSIEVTKHKLFFKGYLLSQDKIDSVISPDLEEEEYAIKLRGYLNYVIMLDLKSQTRYLKSFSNSYKHIAEIIDEFSFNESEFYRMVNDLGVKVSVKDSKIIRRYLENIKRKELIFFNQDKTLYLRKYLNRNKHFNRKNLKHLSTLLKEEDNRNYIELLYAF